jgi:hypothetical protein
VADIKDFIHAWGFDAPVKRLDASVSVLMEDMSRNKCFFPGSTCFCVLCPIVTYLLTLPRIMCAYTSVRSPRLRTTQTLRYVLGQVPLSQSIACDGLIQLVPGRSQALAISCCLLLVCTEFNLFCVRSP